MSKDKYLDSFEDLLKDPESYSTWSSREEEETDDLRSLVEDKSWGDEWAE